MMTKVDDGNDLRAFQLETAVLLAPVNRATAPVPPSASTISAVVCNSLLMPLTLSQLVILSSLHNMEFERSPNVIKIRPMTGEPEFPFADQGKRLRWLRQAEGFGNQSVFAAHMNWRQSAVSQFETGKRRVPLEKGLQLATRIVGFDPQWLWTGDKRGLAFDLRRRIEAEELKERANCLAHEERKNLG